METADNQHRRRNRRSFTDLNHLFLAPLTSSLPLDIVEETEHSVPYSPYGRHISYLDRKSAPTTPRILSRSSSRASLRKPMYNSLQKSKSTANIAARQHQLKFGADPLIKKTNHLTARDDFSLHSPAVGDRNDSDWLLRAGALLSSGARESKGQLWLVSRESSTSLSAQGYEEEGESDEEHAMGRDSRRNSTRGSGTGGDADDEYSPIPTGLGFGGGSRPASRYGSHPASREHSRRGSRANAFTTLTNAENDQSSNLDQDEELIVEPDFVDVEDGAHSSIKDEIIIKRLAKNGNLRLGVWMEQLMRWTLFAVEEDEENTDTETSEEKTAVLDRQPQAIDVLNNTIDDSLDEHIPPPGDGEGAWQDAAWLLSVATKVLL
jgi:hypothetical protein